MYVVMDDSIPQMCYFKRLRKPRIAEKSTTPALRSKAERPRCRAVVSFAWYLQERNGLAAAAATAWSERGWEVPGRYAALHMDVRLDE